MNTAPPRDQVGRATVILILVTLLWGLSFSWMKNWQQAASACPGGLLQAGLTLIALRMSVALAVLLLWQPHRARSATRRELGVGALIGSVFFMGFAMQVWGLGQTTPALSAFLTSLCSAWVPLLAWLCLGQSVAPLTLLGLSTGLAGAAVFGLSGEGWTLGPGEMVTLLASVFFASQVLLLDGLGRTVRSTHLSFGFFAATAGLAWLGVLLVAATGTGLGDWARWTVAMLKDEAVLRDLVNLTLLPTVLAFHWMNTWQPRVSASRAALIYLLEPIFSAVFSVWWGHDQISTALLLGGTLILGGNLMVELPRWLGDPGQRVLGD